MKLRNLHFIFALLLLLSPLVALGQQTPILSPLVEVQDVQAQALYSVKSKDDGKTCAIIKVRTSIPRGDLQFDTDLASTIEQIDASRLGQIWVYLTPGAMQLKVFHRKFEETLVFKNLKERGVYETTINYDESAPLAATSESNDDGGQFFILRTDPQEVELVIDDETRIATTNGYINHFLPTGNHTYSVNAPLYASMGGVVTIADQKVEQQITLKPVFGYISVNSTPTAHIQINGMDVGQTPFTTSQLPFGDHTVRLTASGYEPFERVVTLSEPAATVTLSGEKGEKQIPLKAVFGYISVNSTPVGARVFINGMDVGQTPYTTSQLPFGNYTVRLTASDYEPFERVVTLSEPAATVALSDDKGEKQVALKPMFGYIAASSTPTGARVLINGMDVGQTPFTTSRLPFGEHSVRLTATGYEPLERTVTLSEPAATVTLSETMVSLYSMVSLTAAMQGATIFINEERKGVGSWSGDLGAGEYIVTSTLDGHKESKQRIVVVKNTPLSITLDAPTPMYGKLRVNSSQPDITVTLDGKQLGTAPDVFSNILVGSHTVVYSAKGHLDKSEEITIEEGETVQATVTLKEGSMISENMVFVEGGTFQMGDRNVTLSPFSIGKYEVTQAEWETVMGRNPSSSKGDNKPVENVTWYDCVEFCNALSRIDGREECYQISGTTVTLLAGKKGYRLPTEAEWEYAACGGNKSKGYTYSGSNTIGSVAWYKDNSNSTTHEVGTKQPNELGIYDMSGNVYEWCWDWYGSYGSTSQTDPIGVVSGYERILRGGSWDYNATYCRMSYRYRYNPSIRYNYIGVRLVYGEISAEALVNVVLTDEPTVAAKPMYGKLRVNSSQRDITVTLDGKRLGAAPDVFSNILVGSHTVTYSAKGHIDKSEKIMIEEGKTAQATVTLTAAPVATAPVQATTPARSTSAPKGMVFVEGGTFKMGSNSGDSDEKPVHSVTVSSFYIGKYEVTQAEWESVMGSNPSYTKGANKPVENVSWYDCVKFCNALSRKEGREECYKIKGDKVTLLEGKKGYRLPTEAEWEYAACGGNKSKGYTYSGSNTIGSVAWYKDNSSSTTHVVGTKHPNELGIYDMSGNVWEWCWDWFGRYSSTAQTNSTGATSGSRRVLRGGSWKGDATNCRVSNRGDRTPSDRYNSSGVRLSLVQ